MKKKSYVSASVFYQIIQLERGVYWNPQNESKHSLTWRFKYKVHFNIPPRPQPAEAPHSKAVQMKRNGIDMALKVFTLLEYKKDVVYLYVHYPRKPYAVLYSKRINKQLL